MTPEEKAARIAELQASSAQLRASLAARQAEREQNQLLGLEPFPAVDRSPPPRIIRKTTMTPPSGQQTESTSSAVPAEVQAHVKRALKEHATRLASVLGEEVARTDAALEHRLRDEIAALRQRVGVLEAMAMTAAKKGHD